MDNLHSNSGSTLPITAAVLAGGRSQRMGVDKTLLTVEGRALVSLVCDAIGPICQRTVVVTNHPEKLESAELPEYVEIVVDEVPHQGPLGGLISALIDADTEWVALVAADMPHLEPDLIRALWSYRDGVDAVVPVTPKGLEPLLALYRVDSCLGPARDALSTGRRRVVAMFPSIRVAEVPVEALREVDPELRSLVNINTPEDLQSVRDGGVTREPQRGARPIEVIEVPTTRARQMPSERPVTIYLNDTEVATTQATPSDLDELAVGFLLSEGLISDRGSFVGVESDRRRGMVWVTTTEAVPTDLATRTRYLTSGCGTGATFQSVGHARGVGRVESGVVVTAAEIYDMMRALSAASELYQQTGGMHGAGLGRSGKLLVAREDVGRHNAIDKVLGRAWLDGLETEGAVLLATGRLSYEMALKAAKARVPIAASRSAVTDLAADLADSLGVTLIGYVRGGKITVYTNPERVSMTADSLGIDATIGNAEEQ